MDQVKGAACKNKPTSRVKMPGTPMVKRKDVRMCHGYGIIKSFVKINST